ncbi:BAG family molecular chaperone regulator 1 [Ditylenchus destructor]|uniref:BAG family molecular chaperone regulator 1 n=1 Tax=Ditylenchus destructor TaxID=166010 RepID=A0AAD4RDK5_9BILA|nr:BAG family molecular chaperone regulator 1 [Ditylenchus destructor]
MTKVLKIPVKCAMKELVAHIVCSESEDDVPTLENASNNDDNTKGMAESATSSSAKLLRTVGNLRNFIADEVDGDPEKMKIIFRGKYISTDVNEPLSKYSFKESDKLMVLNIAKKVGQEECPGFKALCDYEKKHLTEFNQTFTKNGADLSELQRNFLEGDKLAEMIRRVEKQLKSFTEAGIRHMEKIDSLVIFSESTSDEQKQRNREKRKSLINGIQDLLNKNDKCPSVAK